MWRPIACIVCVMGVAKLTLLPGRTWHRKGSGFATEVDFTYKGHVREAVDCPRVCSKLSCTKSFFYYDDTRECQCHDIVYTEAEANVHLAPNVRYYEEVIEVIDLANMTGLPCPCHDSVATDVIRSGDSLFRVRAFLETARTYDESQAVCVANGGILYKTTTVEKFNLAQQLMTSCLAYKNADYFVNGKRDMGTSEFMTTDREVMNITAGVWYAGTPNNANTTCIWMAKKHAFKWDDRNCDITDGLHAHAFCEIPQ